MNGDSKLHFNLALLGVLAAVFMTALVLGTADDASAVIIGDAYSGSGDWDINNPTTVIDEWIWVMDGDINVNADLQVWNSEIYMGPSMLWDIYDINVARGVDFQSNDSTFEGMTWYWGFNMDGSMRTDNVDFSFMWFARINGKATCNDTHFYDVEFGLDFKNQLMYTNGTFYYTYNGFNVTSNAMFYNVYSSYHYGGINFTGTVSMEMCDWFYTYEGMRFTGNAKINDTYFYRVYDGFYLSGNVDITYSQMRYMYGLFDCSGTVLLANSTIYYNYNGFNQTNTLVMYDMYCYRMYEGINLMGATRIANSDFVYTYMGIMVTDSKTLIKDSAFYNMYDMGFHFVDCSAMMDNVTVDLYSGTGRSYWTATEEGDSDDRFNMVMGLGIWVDGGSPTFVDVDVEADCYYEFHVEYTGSEEEVTLFARVLVAAVLIDSVDMGTVSGLTIHDSYMNVRTYFDATNPGLNPRYFRVDVQVHSAGLAVVNYANATITDVVSYNNVFGSLYGPYTSGGAYGNSGYYNYGYRYQVVAAIVGDFSSAPASMLTLTGIEVDNGDYWFGHLYMPDYTGTGNPVFANTVLIEDVTVNYAGSIVFHFIITTAYADVRTIDSDVRITGCEFNNIYAPVTDYYLDAGPGIQPTSNVVDIMETFSFDNNTITRCGYYWAYVVVGGGGDNMPNDDWDKMVTIADNEFTESEGTFFYAYAQWDFVKGMDALYVLNNLIMNITDYNWNGPFYSDGFDTVRFIGNEMRNTYYLTTGDFYDYGGSSTGVKAADWLFKDNTFENCTNEEWPEIIFLEFGGDVVFEGNEVSNQNGLLSIMQTSEYTGTSSITIRDNDFHGNMAYFLEYGNPDPTHVNFMILIEENMVYDNEDFFLNYWGRGATLNNYDYDATIIVRDNDFHDNMGGVIHAWGALDVHDNTFNNNAGPLLYIDYINLNVPMVYDNNMNNNEDLFVFVAKDRGFQLVPMSLMDKTLSCTGTALSFTNMEVTLEGVDIVGASMAISAYNTIVNAYWSNIDGDSCEVLADGLITSWWPMEVSVTWGDATGQDSGTPVSEALIVFNDANGAYYSSAYAGIDGVLAEALYRQYSVDLGGPLMYSPYTLKVAAAGATIDVDVTLDMNLTGPDMVKIILWDTLAPVVVITEPYNGAILSEDSVETLGFVAEVGSGLDKVEYSTDGGSTWTPMSIGGTGDWSMTMTDLMDGDVTLMVHAMDIAGNMAETMVTVTVDTTPPTLNVIPPADITNVPSATLTGTVEVGAELYLNGAFLYVTEDSALSVDLVLHEGVNILVLEAIDDAGNIAIETLSIELDTYEPILVVRSPANGLLTNVDSVTVTGVVEVGTTLTIDGTAVVPDDRGMFSHEVTLSAGENEIEVKATDDATNVNMVTITVTQDQDPPDLEILEPDDGTMTDADSISVQISAETDAMVWLNGRRLGELTVTVLLVEGDNVIHVMAKDMAGNVAEESVTVIRDTQPPTLTITDPDAMEVWTNANSLEISGVAMRATTVRAGGNNANYNPTSGEYTVSVTLNAGTNNVTVTASDGVNDVSLLLRVHVDRTAPSLNVDQMESTYRTSSVTIGGNTDEGIKTVQLEYGGITQTYPVEYDGTFRVTLNLPDGSHEVSVTVVDAYGNEALRSTGSFNVKARGIDDSGDGDDGFTVEPIHIGLILAAVGIALIVAAYASAHLITKRRREELE